MSTVEYGALRQVWFAPTSNPDDKHAFLIRDDAYSEREATFGRTIRLGDPVDLGPFGAWRQTNWSGGMDQETWKDEAMFELGTADVSERKGSTKLWNGFKELAADGRGVAAGYGNSVYGLLQPAATGIGDDVPLVVLTRKLHQAGATSPPEFYQYKYSPNPAGYTLLRTWAIQPQAVTMVGDASGSVVAQALIGFANGEIWSWNQSTGAFSQFQVSGPAVGYKAMAAFNDATYYVRGTTLWKVVGGTPSIVKTIPEILEACSMVVWNNRLWFLGLMTQGRTGVFVSDGYTVQLAFVVPSNFVGIDVCSHYGSLYIRGLVNHYGTTVADTRQQVWRYNGSSLVLLWEDDDSDIDFIYEGGLVSWGRHVVWSRHGSAALGRTPGVWMYDAEEDAIYQGPTVEMDPSSPSVIVSSLTVWNNTLVLGLVDTKVYPSGTVQTPRSLAALEKNRVQRSVLLDGTTTVDSDKVADSLGASFGGQSFGYARTSKTQVILSSAYDGGLPGEKKVWVKGYVRCRVPQGCRVRVALLHDDSVTEHPIQTIAYDAGAGAGWRDVQFSAVCTTHNTHETSSKVRYKLYVENIDLATYPNNSPEVDVVGLDFLPSPSRRRQFHVRVVAVDDQTTLDGAANPLSTRDAIVAKLKGYWEASIPLLFWEPAPDGTVPTSTGTPVMVSEFLDQSFLLDTTSAEVASEVSFDLLEVA